ncbi:MAG: M10 family metallopeptidase C-terminal domain-containing protein [Pseudomonadota bacterium]
MVGDSMVVSLGVERLDLLDDGHADICMCQDQANGLELGPMFFPDIAGRDSGLVGTTADNGKPIISAFQAAGLIARNGQTAALDGDLNVTFAFATDNTAGIGFESFTEINKDWAREVFDLYADVSGLTFTEIGPNDGADVILKVQSGTMNGGGFFDGQNVVVGNISFEDQSSPGTFGFNLLLHEIGHAVGLAHPGNYDGAGVTYADDAEFFTDTAQFTNLSYFSETFTGGSFGELATLGLHDILAVQMEYGANTTTRTGDTVYGYNNTSGRLSYDLTASNDFGFSIWDAGGTDWLDFSGSSFETELDLRDGSFSSVDGQIGNLSIAYGAIIENGVGSIRDDLIIGNGVNNTLLGGAGDDHIIGGEADPPSTAPDPRDFIGVQLNADPLTFDQGMIATGVTGIEGGAVTLEMMVDIERTPADNIVFASYAVPGTTNEFLVQGVVGGTLTVHIVGFQFISNVPTASLVDGDPHRLSVTWSDTGILNIYIDGELAQSGFHRPGESLQAGGTLVIGQDQDAVGGGFQPDQIFQGTVGDIRIFNDVRTAQQIDTNKFNELPPSVAGLEHNWKVDAGDTTTITDATGSANLTILNGGTVNETAEPVDTSNDNDSLFGEAGNDTLEGGFGNDLLEGGSGNDTLMGGSGDDTLRGDGGTTPPAPEVFNLLTINQGANQRLVSNGSDLFPTGSFTIEFLMDQGDMSNQGYDIEFGSVRFYRFSDGWIGVLFENASEDAWVPNVFLPGSYDTDGPSRFSLSYDDATGVLTAYVNGVVASTNTVPPGTRGLEGTGNIRIDLDDASFGDIRLYDAALPASEIAANAFEPLTNPNSDPDLVQYWTVNSNGSITQNVTGGDAMNPVGGPSVEQGTLYPEISFNDVLMGEAGNDTLVGGTGDDILIGGSGSDSLSGGGGIDTASYSDSTSGVAASLASGSGSAGDAAGDTFAGIENLRGTAHDDQLTGDGANNRLQGDNGGDNLSGGGGDDLVLGGGGNDTLNGGAGNDTLNGGGDVDLLNGGTGDDVLNTGSGNDTANGQGGNDTLNGQDGNDVLDGGGGDDTVNGAAGNDNLQGGVGNDVLNGGLGNDTMRGGDDNDTLLGQADDDTQFGDAGDDTINGAAGNDTLFGGDGNDILNGGKDGDQLDGGNGNDELRGQGQNDTLFGRGGADILNGAGGNDVLVGGGGGDTLNGGGGNDTLEGGVGNDTLNGQGGIDTYVFDADEDGSDTVIKLEAGETVLLRDFGFASANAANSSFSQSGNNVVFSNSGVTITFQNANLADVRDAVTVQSSSPVLEGGFDFSGLDAPVDTPSETATTGEILGMAHAAKPETPASPETEATDFDVWAFFDTQPDDGAELV